MKRVLGIVVSVFSGAAILGCVTPPDPWDYSGLIKEDPRSILVVPVVNNSPEVGAEYFFLATITVPLAERGYYVFPVNGAHALLAESGLAEPGLVHDMDPVKLAGLFGADSVLYIEIENWESNYYVFGTTVVVGFEYLLKSGKTGDVLWQNKQQMSYTPQTTGGDPMVTLIVMVVQAAVTKAAPNYIPLARQANWAVVAGVNKGGQATAASMIANPLLMGPYHPSYGTDRGAEGSGASKGR